MVNGRGINGNTMANARTINKKSFFFIRKFKCDKIKMLFRFAKIQQLAVIEK